MFVVIFRDGDYSGFRDLDSILRELEVLGYWRDSSLTLARGSRLVRGKVSCRWWGIEIIPWIRRHEKVLEQDKLLKIPVHRSPKAPSCTGCSD